MKIKTKQIAEIILGMQAAYSKGENAMEWCREYFHRANETVEGNDLLATLVAYDLQAGSYVSAVRADREKNQSWCRQLASLLSSVLADGDSILEVGVGEATTLAGVLAESGTKPSMAELFGCPCGLSDHTLGIGAAVAASVLGAVMIEKHLTLRRADGGPDSHFSLEPHEMKALVAEVKTASKALGKIQYGPQEEEKASMQGRRSLYVTVDMAAGELFSVSNIRSIRPGYGLSPKYKEVILGKKVNRAVPAGTPVSWSLIG